MKIQGMRDDDPYAMWDRELREAALDVMADYDLWEIWNAPKVVDLVCERYGVASLFEDPSGEDFQYLEREQLLAIPGVWDAVFRDIVTGGAADERLEMERDRAFDRRFKQ